MVEKQLRLAMSATSNFWVYRMGQRRKTEPHHFGPSRPKPQRNKQPLKKELRLFKKGKLLNIQCEKEFQP